MGPWQAFEFSKAHGLYFIIKSLLFIDRLQGTIIGYIR